MNPYVIVIGFYSTAKKQLDADRKEFEEFKRLQQMKIEEEKEIVKEKKTKSGKETKEAVNVKPENKKTTTKKSSKK